VALLLACTIGIFSTPGGLERQILYGLLVAQIACYALAGFGSCAGRIGTVARTFVVLNAAAAVGLWRFLVGKQKVTW
jgi:hypothetical protein